MHYLKYLKNVPTSAHPFALFSFFSNKIKTCRLQWDSNSDRRSRGQACRPFGHHHHCPYKTYFNYLKYYKFEYTIATYAVSCTALFLLHGYSDILVSFFKKKKTMTFLYFAKMQQTFKSKFEKTTKN